jgi:hypothetical protein
VNLSDIQAVASRSQYLLRWTPDTSYPPYNNWSSIAGQCAFDLVQQMQYWFTWQRPGFFIEQPIGFYIPCDLCDLQTLAYLMYKANGWGRPNVWDPSANLSVDPAVAVATPQFGLEPDAGKFSIATPSFGANEPTEYLADENGNAILCDNFSFMPCYRDWVALGLGNPPNPPGAVDPWAKLPNSWQGAPG